MARPKSLEEILAADGETELPLPPFSASSLVKQGSYDPVEVARLHIPGRSVVGHIPIGDMTNPMYAGYLAQLKDIPDDIEPDGLEKYGFKPPEFFVKKYLEAQAAKEARSPPQGLTIAPAITGRDKETAGDGPCGVGEEDSNEEEEVESVLSPSSACIGEKETELA